MFEITEKSAVELACGIQGWMNRDELAWLYRTAGNCDLWIEVGAWKGRSVLATALGLKHNGRIIVVDNCCGSQESEVHIEATIPGWLKGNLDLVKSLIWQLRADLDVAIIIDDSLGTAARMRGDWLADGVFIDASHLKENVLADIDAWLPMVKPGGVLCGHDVSPSHPGVEEAVIERFGNDWERPPGTNLWVWRKPL